MWPARAGGRLMMRTDTITVDEQRRLLDDGWQTTGMLASRIGVSASTASKLMQKAYQGGNPEVVRTAPGMTVYVDQGEQRMQWREQGVYLCSEDFAHNEQRRRIAPECAFVVVGELRKELSADISQGSLVSWLKSLDLGDLMVLREGEGLLPAWTVDPGIARRLRGVVARLSDNGRRRLSRGWWHHIDRESLLSDDTQSSSTGPDDAAVVRGWSAPCSTDEDDQLTALALDEIREGLTSPQQKIRFYAAVAWLQWVQFRQSGGTDADRTDQS